MMTDTIPKWQRVTGWVLSGILSLMFLPSAFFKIAQPKGFIEEWSKTYPAASALPIGIIEVTVFVLYLVPKTATSAASSCSPTWAALWRHTLSPAIRLEPLRPATKLDPITF